ncbi:MAG: nucleoside triphosphate pyrophosphohydrolase [Thermoanaerobaculia bacterium]|nr:nucleoside triphosphate pyrophosphohydrolase [Thermoanaerobaculia bacterium]
MSLRDLVTLVETLRGPEGCPWDREQSPGSIRAYLVEEAHELAAALDRGDWSSIGDELGDLLFQAAFIVRLGEEAGELDLEAVLEAQQRKMVNRHPHVFGGETLESPEEVAAAWEQRKIGEGDIRLLDGVPDSLPALVGAYRIGQKAAAVGFDWPDAEGPRAKISEELEELDRELAEEDLDLRRVSQELGDLLFALANLGRHLGIDPEASLARANRRFRRRFSAVEAALEERDRTVEEADLDELEELWQRAKESRPE